MQINSPDTGIKSQVFGLSGEKNIHLHQNVYFLSELKPEFESSYISTRQKEKRILSDEDVKRLPLNEGPHAAEWRIRLKTAESFCRQLKSENRKTILEVGCGNGWFSNYIAANTSHTVIGTDVNFEELQQASRLFRTTSCDFLYYDILEEKLLPDIADHIVFNSSIQYFRDLKKTIGICLKLLKPDGSIYLLDSPFYTKENVLKAKTNSRNYFSGLGSEEMIPHYHHHTFEELNIFKWEDLNTSSLDFIYKRIPYLKTYVFPFIRIVN